MSPALKGRFLTTGSPREVQVNILVLFPLVFAQSLSCEQARLLWESSLSDSFFSSLSLSLAISRLLPQIVLRAFRPSTHPKYAARASLFNPTCCWRTRVQATSPLGVAARHVICGFFSSPSWLCCPPRFQNSPTDPQVRGFPGVWKLLLLHNSLPGTGLHP